MGRSYIICNKCGNDTDFCECPPTWTAKYIKDHGGNLETILREHESHAARLTAAEARVRELEAIVERLPKTKDGVYVIPGQDVWVWWTNGQCYRVDFADNTIPVWIGDSVDGGRDVRVDECYSTREAAEAAAKETP